MFGMLLESRISLQF